MGDWRPARGPEERLDRAIRSMVPGSLQGRVAQASPVLKRNRQRYPMDPDDAAEIAGGTVLFWQDEYDAGALTFDLTYEPIENSEHVYWEGVLQPSTEWSRVGKKITLSDAGGLVQAGHQVVVEYAYYEPIVVTNDPLGGNAQEWDGNDWATARVPAPTFSFSVLVKPDQAQSTLGPIATNESGSGANTRWFLNVLGDGRLEFQIKRPDMSTNSIFSGGSIRDGKAHHVVITYDNATTTATLYLDGQVAASGVYSMNTQTNTALNLSARYLASGGYYYKGVTDEIVTWSRALTASEVAEQYAAWGAQYRDVVNASTPTDYWTLDSTSGTNEYSTTGTGTAINWQSGTPNDAPALQKGA